MVVEQIINDSFFPFQKDYFFSKKVFYLFLPFPYDDRWLQDYFYKSCR